MTATKKTLKNKIAQMLIMGFKARELEEDQSLIDDFFSWPLGGTILFDQNVEGPQLLKSLITKLKSKSKVPLLVSMDYEGGRVTRLKESKGFPPTLSAHTIAALSEKEAIKHVTTMAKTLQDAGINL